MNTATHYEPSGKIDPAMTVISVLVAMAIVTGLSFLYVFFTEVIPIIYLAILILIGYGLTLGYLTKMVMFFGKFRSKPAAYGVALLLSVWAIITSWLAFISYLSLDYASSFSDYLTWFPELLYPSNLATIIGEVNEYGTWGVGVGSSGNNTVSGFLLTLVWIAEIATLIAMPLISVRAKSLPPFSEEEDAFFDEFILKNDFQGIISGGKASELLVERPLDYLASIEVSSRFPISRVVVYTLPRSSVAYVSILKVRVNHKQQEEVHPVVEHLRVPGAVAREILGKYEAKKDPIGVLMT